MHKFCGSASFPHIFERIVRNSAQTKRLRKISKTRISVKLWYFMQWQFQINIANAAIQLDYFNRFIAEIKKKHSVPSSWVILEISLHGESSSHLHDTSPGIKQSSLRFDDFFYISYFYSKKINHLSINLWLWQYTHD